MNTNNSLKIIIGNPELIDPNADTRPMRRIDPSFMYQGITQPNKPIKKKRAKKISFHLAEYQIEKIKEKVIPILVAILALLGAIAIGFLPRLLGGGP